MFFYQGAKGEIPHRSNRTMRVATLTTLIAYPLGAVSMIVFPDTTPEPGLTFGEILGFGLIAVALFAFCFVAPSQLQRIVGESAGQLDEFELDLRRKAHTFAHQAFAGIVLIGLMYMGVASDVTESSRFQFWYPSMFDHWNAIFWGAMLYAFVLPTTYLAFAGPAPLDDEADDPGNT